MQRCILFAGVWSRSHDRKEGRAGCTLGCQKVESVMHIEEEYSERCARCRFGRHALVPEEVDLHRPNPPMAGTISATWKTTENAIVLTPLRMPHESQASPSGSDDLGS